MIRRGATILGMLSLVGSSLVAQFPPGQQRSDNVKLLDHVPLGAAGTVMDIEMEQELSRPYVYVARSDYGRAKLGRAMGMDIVSVREPERAKVIYRWRIEQQELHQGLGGMDNKHFKLNGRYYDVQSFQFRQSGPDLDLCVIVFDVTGLPDTSTIREVGRIHLPETPGGCHNIFAYKHSDGRVLLFTTAESAISDEHGANIYDMERLLAGHADRGLVGRVPLPEPRGARRGYHDPYVAYHPESGQDRFYGGGPEGTYEGGNYVFDVTDVSAPRLLATIRPVPSQQSGGHTFVATPDGRYGLTEMTSLGHTPIRFFDLQPALEGKETVLRPIAEWTADWIKSSHNMEIRWPYVFVSAYEDGLQVLDMRNPRRPHAVAFYDTYDHVTPYSVGGEASGVFGVDVRNADGLIVAADMHSGFWAFKMEGFDGWNGHDWGMPNISTVQDWDNGPDGAPARTKVSRN